jgi:hypothetical protein
VITADAAPETWCATLQLVLDDKYLVEIFQSTITEDGRVICPTGLDNSKWSYSDQLGLK